MIRKTVFWIPLLLALILSMSALTVLGSTAVTPNASSNTQRVLSYVSTISGHSLSGQFAGYAAVTNANDPGHWDGGLLSSIGTITGKVPAIMGCDYYNGGDTGSSVNYNYSNCNTDLRTHWNNKGLVQVTGHLQNPITPSLGLSPQKDGSGNPVPYSSSQIAAMLNTAGGNCSASTSCTNWYNELWRMYTGLLDLKNQGVTVLYRPLHEMTGNWFWWGGLAPSDYIAMWNSVFQYMTTSHGTGYPALDNIIWVYAPDFQNKWGSGKGVADYYPGDSKVDIVALDAYDDNPGSNTALTSAYTAITNKAPSKPFAFSEIGPAAWSGGTKTGTFDFSATWLNAIKTKFPKTRYWMAWNNAGGTASNPTDKFMPIWNDPSGGNTSSSNYKNKALYNDSWTINRSDVAW